MYRLADRILDGGLEAKLRRWRAAGVSLRSIQLLLEELLGVRLALETVRRWVHDLDEDGEAA